jgi:hypothetical protein
MLLGIVKVRVGLLDQEQAKAVWVDTIGCEETRMKVTASSGGSRCANRLCDPDSPTKFSTS